LIAARVLDIRSRLYEKLSLAILATFTFLVFFFSTTVIMTILYALDEAPLSF
jgi:hypothetical protein